MEGSVIKPKNRASTPLSILRGYLSENSLKKASIFILMSLFLLLLFLNISPAINNDNVSPGLLFFDPPSPVTTNDRLNVVSLAV